MRDDIKFWHSWGDPREPEYYEVNRIATVGCQREKLSLYFKVVPREIHSDQITWAVVAPANIRSFANGNLEESRRICDDVLWYLSQEHIKKEFKRHRKIDVVFILDANNIPCGIRWLFYKFAEFRKQNPRIFMLFPEMYAALHLALGYTIASLGYIFEVPTDYRFLFRAAVYSSVCLSLIRLAREVRFHYRAIKMVISLAKFSNKNLNTYSATISAMIKACGFSYFITTCLAGILVYIVNKLP